MYNKMWHQTQEALNTLLDKEIQKMTEPQRNKVLVFQMLATFYIKYVQIFRSMENVYDQIVHPQKRTLIRKILDGVMGRILELKNEMVELELTEFHYFDDILQDLKLAPLVTFLIPGKCCCCEKPVVPREERGARRTDITQEVYAVGSYQQCFPPAVELMGKPFDVFDVQEPEHWASSRVCFVNSVLAKKQT
ncbi:IQ and AAA domain-containing protein 1 [Cricetulus griseus]|uniref:IQ and AAA domain-containing protein 1 n=1 Tax=Cricetulus griseus TaxID=10029 RepID=G3ILM2_CRIGR|nr:IQ and AAA domain-containing protein 1 [Cricetulus griseus]